MQRKLSASLLLALLFAGILMVGLKVSPVSASHVVDGVISPGEYDTGMAVQLVGRTDPTWNVSAYIDWDTEFLYVAVNESVPAGSGTQSWIEFAMDAGPGRSVLDGFVLFCNGDQEHAQCSKPGGTWGWTPYAFLAATGTATEFKVNYTDFGIAFGDTIKISIDRNQGPAPPPPYGFAAFWPQNAVVYDGSPNQADPTTWGNVYLSPSPVGHVVDGVISPGEYATGVAVQLVGRTDPTWKVDAYIDWGTEYLYVAVNESVPPGSGTQSWIELAMDAGPARPVLDGFVLFCNGDQEHGQCPKLGGTWGWTPYAFIAATGTATEFKVNYTDFGIAFGDTIKISIDRNQGPPPPAPYGFAAFWPEGAVVYDGHPDPTTWGNLTLAARDVAVTNVTPVKTVVGRGYIDNITVATANLGGITEAFNVWVYANLSLIAPPMNIALPSGDSALLTFSWNTTGFAYGNYTVTAYVGPVPGETDTANNNFTFSVVKVTIPGDLTGDFKVTLVDLVTLAMSYGATPTDSRWSSVSTRNADIDSNNSVGLTDLVILANNYGHQIP